MIFQESVNIVRLSSVFAKTVTGNLFVIFYALSKVAMFMLYQILYMQTKNINRFCPTNIPTRK